MGLGLKPNFGSNHYTVLPDVPKTEFWMCMFETALEWIQANIKTLCNNLYIGSKDIAIYQL